jgi:hypothetical protein
LSFVRSGSESLLWLLLLLLFELVVVVVASKQVGFSISKLSFVYGLVVQ